MEEYRGHEREVREIYPRLPCSDVTGGLLLLQSVSVEEYRGREREVREIYPRLPCSDVTGGLLLLQSVSVEEYRGREREVREIYPRLPCSDVTGGLLLVPAAWLTAWLAGEPPGPVNMTSLLCQHGKLSPWHAAKTKCVDPGAVSSGD